MFAFDLIFEIIKGSFATEIRQICPRYAIHVYWYLFRTYRTYYSIYPFRKLARFSLFYFFSLFNEIKFSLFVYLRTTLYPLLSSFMGGGAFWTPICYCLKGFNSTECGGLRKFDNRYGGISTVFWRRGSVFLSVYYHLPLEKNIVFSICKHICFFFLYKETNWISFAFECPAISHRNCLGEFK